MRPRVWIALTTLALWAVFACGADPRSTSAHSPHATFAWLTRTAPDARIAQRLAPRDEAIQRAAADEEEDTRGRLVSEGWRATRDQRFSELGARLGDTASEPLDIGISRFERLRISITLANAASAPAAVDHGRVFYANAFAGTDRVLVSDASSLEELLVLRDERAPRSFTWNIQPSSGITQIANRQGGLQLTDERGRTVIAMAAPHAWDAHGRTVDVATTWDETARSVTLRVPEVALDYPVAIDPEYDTSVWVRSDYSQLAARTRTAMAFDRGRGELVLFGGALPAGPSFFTPLADTWVWNGASWQRRTPTTSPSARFGHAMAFDQARREVVLFGGEGFRDTWVWNGVNWAVRAVSTAPSTRSRHAMVYDAARSEVVLFGGVSEASQPLADTWAWDGAAWSQRSPSTSPSARLGHAMTYDAARGAVVLFGGTSSSSGFATSAYKGDTWTWNGASWSVVSAAVAPSARDGSTLAFDEVRSECVLFGGTAADGGSSETWRWNGVSWTQATVAAAPAERPYHAFAFDPVRGETILFGGGGVPVTGGSGVTVTRGDTWSWNGSSWTRRGAGDSPAARTGHALAFDTLRNELVLFGGQTGGRFADDTWTYDGVAWTRHEPSVAPTARYSHTMSFDRARGEVVLFGGWSDSGRLDDTWTWNGRRWTRRAIGLRPSPRTGAAMAYDAIRGETILFGGVDGGYGSERADTWAWNGSTWTEQTSATSPAARTGAKMAFDAVRGEVVLFGGSYLDTVSSPVYLTVYFDDTWVWNGTTWTERVVSPRPPARANHSLTFDAARGETIAFGGVFAPPSEQPVAYSDTWAWNGSAWSVRPAPSAARSNHAATFDEARGTIVAFGGDVRGASGDTITWDGVAWALRTSNSTPRYGGKLAYDEARHQVVLFGGGPFDTWTWDGSAWNQRWSATAPPRREKFALAYDAARSETVLFGGIDSSSRGPIELDDTWTWNGSNWTARAPASKPSARHGHVMAYDSARAEVVLFSGASPTVGDTWTWNGAAWTERHPGVAPPARVDSAMAFDTRRNEVVLFGGVNGAFVTLGDLWTWNGAAWSVVSTGFSPGPRSAHAMAYDTALGATILYGGIRDDQSSASETWLWTGAAWLQRQSAQSPPANGGSLVFDAAHARSVYTAGGETWTHTTAGTTCASNDDCGPALSCVDGVCCGTSTCRTCETCAGARVGRCMPVTNREDADTCAARDGKSCSATGDCRAALGSVNTDPTQCASGFIVDGVCCETATCAACETCDSAKKENNQYPGRCGAAISGTDPHDDCANEGAASCGRTGACDGTGHCAVYSARTPCGQTVCNGNRSTGRLCTGSGACLDNPGGIDCGAYACTNGACPTRCDNDTGCTTLYHCEANACVPNRGAVCDGDHTVTSAAGVATDCAPYRCEGSTCKTGCTRNTDCVKDADCTSDGVCAVPALAPPAGEGGCSTSPNASRVGAPWLIALAFGWLTRRARRTTTRPSAGGCSSLRSCAPLRFPRIVALLAVLVACGSRTISAQSPHATLASIERIAASDASLAARVAAREGAIMRGDASDDDETRGRLVSEGWRSTREKHFSDLGARFGDKASDPMDIGVSRFDASRITVSLANAADAKATLDGGRVVYPEALASTDRVIVSDAGRVEELLYLHDDRAPRSFVWNMHVSIGITRVESRDGGLAFLDARGGTQISMAAPKAWDARGAPIGVHVAWNAVDQSLTLSLPVGAMNYPLIVDPEYATSVWVPADYAELTPGADDAMAYDAIRHETVLFTRSATWTWNGAKWSHRAPAASPAWRGAAAMVFDPVRGEVVLFGGRGNLGDLGDTWAWNGVTWTRKVPPVSPGARSGHAMAFDAVRHEIVLFGGTHGAFGGTSDNETWVWNGTVWSQRMSTVSPSARLRSAMAFDGARGEMLLFGGRPGDTSGDAELADTWAWNGVTWAPRTTATAPSARSGHTMSFDTTRNQVMLFAGGAFDPASGPFGGRVVNAELWSWNGAKWTNVSVATSPPSRAAHAAAFDTARGRLVVVGGESYASLSIVARGDMWEWDGAAWANPRISNTATLGPPPCRSSAIAFDSARGQMVLACSNQYGPNAGTFATWVWDGTRWTARMTDPAPPPFASSAMVHDLARGETVLFGQGSTWIWNGVTWQMRSPARAPSELLSVAMVYDSARAETVLFGTDGASPETWVWNGVSWTQRSPATTPEVTFGEFGMAYDSARRETVLCSSGAANTWIWNGTDWAARGASPAQFTGGVGLAFDSVRARVVLMGAGASSNATWLWNGSAWTSMTPGTMPRSLSRASMAFDSARGELVLFGGNRDDRNTLAQSGTWTWNGTTWTARVSDPLPPASGSMTLDTARHEVVLFIAGNPSETWTWMGTWRQQSPAVSPRGGAEAVAFDAQRGEVILFGGLSGNTALAETWAWNGATWTQRSPASAPAARSGHVMTYDAVRHEVILFGGGSNFSPTNNETWTWDGSTWTRRTPTLAPSPRAKAAMTFDASRGQSVLFGGIAGSTRFHDTWTWDGVAWTQASPDSLPVERDSAAVAYNDARGETILFGGINNAGPLNDTWAWNGTTWARRTPLVTPSMYYNGKSALVADGKLGELMLLVSADWPSPTQMWFHATAGGTCASSDDCIGSATCVDGVCCNVSVCGTCESCAGTRPGRCMPVSNQEDPDTCAQVDGKSCSDIGVCGVALGVPATSTSACASGFIVDGVCCDVPSCGACQTCDIEKKARHEYPGRCGASKAGTDFHDDCTDDGARSCQKNGQCDGEGRCQVYAGGTPCGETTCAGNRATGLLCTGGGACLNDATGVECAPFGCVAGACRTGCESNADCAALHHCEGAMCVEDHGATCDGNHTVTSPNGNALDCGRYRCDGAQCKVRCERATDCVIGADCTFHNTCITTPPAPISDGAGCHAARGGFAPRFTSLACLLTMVGARRRRKKNRVAA